MKARIKKTGKVIDVLFDHHIENGTTYYREKGAEGNYPMASRDSTPVYAESSLDFEDTIDWEQRRYEIAKDALCAVISADRPINFSEILDTADALIAELKNKEE